MLVLLLATLAFAQGSPSYTGANSVRALQLLEKASSKDPAKLEGAELESWARARFAWVALLRLEGREEEALKRFAGCGVYCGKAGLEKEWVPLRKWGCGRSPEAAPCKTGAGKGEKTKAPKPPL